jgi:hypothetical protein
VAVAPGTQHRPHLKGRRLLQEHLVSPEAVQQDVLRSLKIQICPTALNPSELALSRHPIWHAPSAMRESEREPVDLNNGKLELAFGVILDFQIPRIWSKYHQDASFPSLLRHCSPITTL